MLTVTGPLHLLLLLALALAATATYFSAMTVRSADRSAVALLTSALYAQHPIRQRPPCVDLPTRPVNARAAPVRSALGRVVGLMP